MTSSLKNTGLTPFWLPRPPQRGVTWKVNVEGKSEIRDWDKSEEVSGRNAKKQDRGKNGDGEMSRDWET